ncbi:MAG TPA: exodeoxyribonuclease VII large subunit [Flavisolibacter sp.]
MSEVVNDKKVFTLEEVGLSVKKTLARRYTSSFWVKAEMNKLNHYSSFGHCYPDLVQRKNGKVIAEMKAILWKTDYIRIQNKFLQVLREPLKDGIQILFCAKIVFEPEHGIRLRIFDIDPSYSLGELELEKQATINRLKAEGVFNKNKLLKLPFLPKRIAVISVQSSKGYNDFLQKIEPNPWCYRLFHMLFPSLLQGDRAVTEIVGQLNRIKRVIHHFDAVAIIRGGGGNIGLSCYNHYALCKELAVFPIPVVTGIGHATNETAAEMVSYKNCITPTDLADFLLQKFHNVSVPLQELEKKLAVRSVLQLKETKTSLENTGKYFQSITKNSLLDANNSIVDKSNIVRMQSRHILNIKSNACAVQEYNLFKNTNSLVRANHRNLENTLLLLRKEVLVNINHSMNCVNQLIGNLYKDSRVIFIRLQPELLFLKDKMDSSVKRTFFHNDKEIKSIEHRVELGDPINLLKRGYTITLVNNKALRSSKEVNEGDTLTTVTADGKITSIATFKQNI